MATDMAIGMPVVVVRVMGNDSYRVATDVITDGIKPTTISERPSHSMGLTLTLTLTLTHDYIREAFTLDEPNPNSMTLTPTLSHVYFKEAFTLDVPNPNSITLTLTLTHVYFKEAFTLDGSNPNSNPNSNLNPNANTRLFTRGLHTRRVSCSDLGIGLGSALALALALEEVFVFDGKRENMDSAVEAVEAVSEACSPLQRRAHVEQLPKLGG